MNITCEMAEDLLPLYLEGTCSADSRAALEAHLHICRTAPEESAAIGSGRQVWCCC